MTQIKDMTTAEWRKVWTEIAIAFEAAPKKRSEHQEQITRCGLCYAFDQTKDKVVEIDGLLGGFADRGSFDYWVPPKYLDHGKDHSGMGWSHRSDLIRATYAAMFAAMTPKEFLKICEAPQGRIE